MKFYSPTLAEGSELNNLTIPTGTSFPANENAGEMFLRTDENLLYYYTGTEWTIFATGAGTAYVETLYIATASQTTFNAIYTVGRVSVFLNGVLLKDTTDYAATNGTSVILTVGAAVNDGVTIIAYGSFQSTAVINAAQLDGQPGSYYAPIASPALTGSPTAPTQTSGDNSTNIATTAYVDAGGGGISVATVSGTISHGGTIPLPSGYTQAQCKWMVSMANSNGSNQNGNSLETFRVFASTSRVVTCQLFVLAGKTPSWQSEDANYIIIGIK